MHNVDADAANRFCPQECLQDRVCLQTPVEVITSVTTVRNAVSVDTKEATARIGILIRSSTHIAHLEVRAGTVGHAGKIHAAAFKGTTARFVRMTSWSVQVRPVETVDVA